jgi:hypothetical protein
MALHSDTASKEAAEAGRMFSINLVDFIELGFEIPIVVPDAPCYSPKGKVRLLSSEGMA